MRRRGLAVAAVALLAVCAGVAAAHGGGGEFEAPLPLSYLFVGAAATVGATAVVAAGTGRVSGGEERRVATVPGRVARPVRAAARVGFVALVAAALAAGVAGPASADNLAVAVVWPVWVKGLALWSMIAGSPWRTLSPWRAVYDWLTALEGGEFAVLGEYPEWLGEWPALVGFVAAVGIAENLTAAPRSPRLTAALVAGYATVMLVGGAAFGPAWFRRADFLEVLYRLFGRVAPVRAAWTADGGWRVVARAPWRDPAKPVESTAVAWFVVATVYTVSFDGFAGSPEYRAVADAVGGLLPAGVGVALYLLGFAGFVAALSAVAALAGGGVRALAPTLLPIAAAYEAAHNYAFALTNLGTVVEAVAGAVGVPGSVHLLGWLSLPAFWASQVALVVAGHVVAVLAAHLVVERGRAARTRTLAAHAPLTALMVGYTVLSLWLVSRPVVG